MASNTFDINFISRPSFFLNYDLKQRSFVLSVHNANKTFQTSDQVNR